MSKGLIVALVTGAGVCAWIAAQLLDKFPGDGENNLHPRNRMPPFPDNRLENIHWFVQISDLHISIFWDPDRIKQFKSFCTEYVDIIKPEVVLVSGDLTDAKEKDYQGSKQYEWEWKQYSKVLNSSGVLRKTVWLDTRGNHDVFAVPSSDHKLNYFRQYSVQGAKYPGSSYIYHHKLSNGSTISFIAVDSCPRPGPRRPFNFFGIMDQEGIERLQELAEQSASSNVTVWFGHYPTSTVVSPSKAMGKIISERGSVYMCGHLHTLAGLVPSMYSSQPSGSLELELGDWKENRMLRVFAVDHDMFSFTDEQYGRWPIVLITNPKHGQFNMPKMEPLARMINSTHIRMLIFSNGSIEKVTVNIDGYKLGQPDHAQGPLYVLPWNPADFKTGIHRINVFVRDSLGNERLLSQPFTMDNSRMPFDFLRKAILQNDHATTIIGIFFAELATFIGTLILIYLFKNRIKTRLGEPWGNCLGALVYSPLVKLYMVACHRKVFLLTLAFAVYVAIGPWFIGEILEGEYGVMFAWGLIVHGQYVPGSLTYLYAFFQLLFFNIPLTYYLGYCIELTQEQVQKPAENNHHVANKWRRHAKCAWTYIHNHVIFYAVVIMEAYLAYSGFYLAYGGLALLMGPVRTFSIPYAFLLRSMALTPGQVNSADFIVHNALKAR